MGVADLPARCASMDQPVCSDPSELGYSMVNSCPPSRSVWAWVACGYRPPVQYEQVGRPTGESPDRVQCCKRAPAGHEMIGRQELCAETAKRLRTGLSLLGRCGSK